MAVEEPLVCLDVAGHVQIPLAVLATPVDHIDSVDQSQRPHGAQRFASVPTCRHIYGAYLWCRVQCLEPVRSMASCVEPGLIVQGRIAEVPEHGRAAVELISVHPKGVVETLQR